MTRSQILEIELLRRIEIFQSAVITQTLNETPKTTHRLAVARENLSSFILDNQQKEEV